VTDHDSPARPPRRWIRPAVYALAAVFVALGCFMTFVALRMERTGESIGAAVVGQTFNIPTPRDAFRKDRIYVLVLGIDYDYDDRDQPSSAHARSDTIMVAGLDFPTKKARLISVLRDTDAVIAGRETKINAAYSIGGVKLADSVIGEFLGLPGDKRGRHFDRYVVVRVSALKDLVDAIGGIDVKVAQAMDYDDSWGHLHIHFKPGLVHMNGEQAQGYARFRHDECSDPCRIKRQQDVIRIVIDKLKRDRLNDLGRVGALVSVFRRDVDTNLSFDELKALSWSFKDAPTADLAHANTIGYVDLKQTLDGEVVIPDERQKATLVADLLGPYTAPKVPAGIAALTPADVHVIVENGSGVRGAATQMAAFLRSRGYVVDAIGDADSFGYDTTQIQESPAGAGRGARVRADLGVGSAVVAQRPATGSAADTTVRIVVGKDYSAKH
jgi:LCP family protein required for cell wall assembly